jgi:PAS domain S-box-containing protein
MKIIEKYRGALSIAIWLVLSVLVIWFWEANRQWVRQSMENKVEVTSELLAQQFLETISAHVEELENLKHRLEMTDGEFFQYWNRDAQQIINQESSFKFIEWIDSTGVIQRVEPMQGNEQAIGLNILELDYRRMEWRSAARDSMFNITHWLELVQGDYSFLVDAPVYIKGQFHGTITAGMDFSAAFDGILQDIEGYHIEIRDNKGITFYSIGPESHEEHLENMAQLKRINIEDISKTIWTVTVIPNAQFWKANTSWANTIILMLALMLSVLVALSFYYVQKSSSAEKSARLANQKMRALINSAPIGIYVINAEGRVIDFWNPAAENMLGWPKEEVLGKLHPILEQEFSEKFMDILNKTIQKDGLINQVVTRKRRDGSEGIFRLNIGSMIRDEQHMLVLVEDITKEKEYEKRLQNSLEEKEILLAEVHHRVKNNLAIIIGLIELQKRDVYDEQFTEILNETKNRIYSISGVHEMLYQSESFTDVNFKEYFDRLIKKLIELYDSERIAISINQDIEHLNININQAVPLGLLLNELITNSIKHAFQDIQEPRIDITFSSREGRIVVIYTDNGQGIDKTYFTDEKSLGIVLIKTLLGQLAADYHLIDGDGFGIHFEFDIIVYGSHSLL